MGGPDSQKREKTASAAEACSYKFLSGFAELHKATYVGHKLDKLENESQLTEHEMVLASCCWKTRERVVNDAVFNLKTTDTTWLILPVVICLSQRLSHACLSINFSR